jgi:methyltransferase family protein
MRAWYPSLIARRSFFIVCFSIAAIGSFAHAQQTTFEPKVGQPGKDVVWVPSPQALVDKMLDMAKVTPQDYLIDLGSGDGRTVITAAKRGTRAMGIEYEPDMVALSQRNAASENVSGRATFVKADLFQSDFSQATVITMFLLPQINLDLRPKILDLKPGTRIISNTFTMGEWNADQTATVTDCDRWCTALLWIVPAKVEGAWRSPQGDLGLTQTFQMLSGTLRSGATATPITEGKMVGDLISFSAGNARFSGRVSGNTIEGTVTTGTGGSPWRASR